MAGKNVRDKDAVVSCLLIAEMAAVSASQGETLVDRLEHFYEQYVHKAEYTFSIIREG